MLAIAALYKTKLSLENNIAPWRYWYFYLGKNTSELDVNFEMVITSMKLEF